MRKTKSATQDETKLRRMDIGDRVPPYIQTHFYRLMLCSMKKQNITIRKFHRQYPNLIHMKISKIIILLPTQKRQKKKKKDNNSVLNTGSLIPIKNGEKSQRCYINSLTGSVKPSMNPDDGTDVGNPKIQNNRKIQKIN